MKKLMLILLCCISFSAQAAKEIKLIIPYSPGGSADRVGRVLEKELNNKDYTFIVEFKLGAGGQIATDYVATTKTGTVLLLQTSGIITTPILSRNFTYDVYKDFIPVGFLGNEPMIMVVPSSSGIANFKDFKKVSKTIDLPYGSSGNGTVNHLMGEIISNKNKHMIHIPYKGGSAALVDLLGGRLSWLVESDSLLGPYIADNKVRPLAVYSMHRLPKYPNVPTVAELGITKRNFFRWYVLLANTGADPQVIAYVKEKLKEPKLRAELTTLGLELVQVNDLTTLFNEEAERAHGILVDFLN